MKTCLVLNPAAKSSQAARSYPSLRELGTGLAIRLTTGAGSARRIAAKAVREGFQTLVAGGGDGTVNEVINGIGDVPGGFQEVQLGLIPLGTANVLGKELGIPTRMTEAWSVIQERYCRPIRIPRCTSTQATRQETRYFAQLGGAGLDARAIEEVNLGLKRRAGALAYVLAGFRTLLKTQHPITISNGRHTARGELVLIGNGRYYGGRYTLFPGANPEEPQLHACIFETVRWFHLPRRSWGLFTDTLHHQSGIRHLSGDRFELTSPDPVPVELEGESAGRLPAVFEIGNQRLRVLVPHSA